MSVVGGWCRWSGFGRDTRAEGGLSRTAEGVERSGAADGDGDDDGGGGDGAELVNRAAGAPARAQEEQAERSRSRGETLHAEERPGGQS